MPRAAELAADEKVLFDAEGGKQTPALGHQGDSACYETGCPQSTGRFTREPDEVSIDRDQSGNTTQQRALTRAIRTDDRHDLPGLHGHRHVTQRLEIAVERRETAYLQQGHR